MLPVTHGQDDTRLQVLLYTLILFGVALLPFAIRMSGLLYLARRSYSAVSTSGMRCASTLLQRSARAAAFRYSIVYLSVLFAALLVDITCSLLAPRRRMRGCAEVREHRHHRPPIRPELALTEHDGKPRTLEDFRGKAVVPLLRLYALSRRLPDDAGRHGRRR